MIGQEAQGNFSCLNYGWTIGFKQLFKNQIQLLTNDTLVFYYYYFFLIFGVLKLSISLLKHFLLRHTVYRFDFLLLWFALF